ncbi:MAG: hypothetical protein LBU97_02845 [Alistipes sp.]|jgi:hypothetical protein|nr:hypothetical protein [Alistipes sp.]
MIVIFGVGSRIFAGFGGGAEIPTLPKKHKTAPTGLSRHSRLKDVSGAHRGVSESFSWPIEFYVVKNLLPIFKVRDCKLKTFSSIAK